MTKEKKGSDLLIIPHLMDHYHIYSAVCNFVSKDLLTCLYVSGQRRDCPLFHLYVQTAGEAR